MNEQAPPAIMILGCGYLGCRLARQAMRAGYTVDILTRNPETLRQMKQEGARMVIEGQLQSKDWHAQANPNEYQLIAVTVGSAESTPKGYEISYIEGLRSVITWSNDFKGRIVYTSSISVYGDSDGDWIDEQTVPQPMDWRGQKILESENLLLRHPCAQTTVFRLGGIYGPERNRFLTSGPSANSSRPSNYHLNLIHVDDAAGAILALSKVPLSTHEKSIYNLTSNHPFKRGELDVFVTQHFPERIRTVAPKRHRSNPANRKIRSESIQTFLSWKPTHTSIFAAFADLV